MSSPQPQEGIFLGQTLSATNSALLTLDRDLGYEVHTHPDLTPDITVEPKKLNHHGLCSQIEQYLLGPALYDAPAGYVQVKPKAAAKPPVPNKCRLCRLADLGFTSKQPAAQDM
jgi:hypothetical protein